MEALKSIVAKFETVINLNSIVNQSCSVDNGVLTSEELHDTLPSRLLEISAARVDHSVDDMLMVWDNEAEYALDSKVEIVDVVTLLVHIGILCGETWAQF